MKRTVSILAVLFPCLFSAALGADIALLVLDNNSYLVQSSVQGLDMQGVTVQVISANDIKRRRNQCSKAIKKARVIVVDVMGSSLEEFVENTVNPLDKTVYALRGSTDDQRLEQLGFLFDPEVSEYYANLGRKNIRNMLRLVAHRHFDKGIKYAPVVKTPQTGIFHPVAGQVFQDINRYMAWLESRPGFNRDSPFVGFLFFSSFMTPGQEAPLEKIVKRLEDEGFNVIPCFGRDRETLGRFLIDSAGRPRVDLVLAFTFKFYSALTPELSKKLNALGVPIINAISIFNGTVDEWRKSPVGIAGSEVAWAIATPEISGLVEPTPLSGKKQVTDSRSGSEYFLNVTIDENLDRLMPRLHKWIALGKKPPEDRRVALMFYNHSQGKQNVGASYLNVFESIASIMQALSRQGYDVGRLPSGQKIKELILSSARNVGSWAPGELEKLMRSPDVVRIPVSTYRKWFATLPRAFRKEVVKQWGEPEEQFIMRDGNDIIVPAVLCGNCVLLPEPSRGWSDDPMKLYHDPSIYPHHQYLAAYLWLQKEFRADVMVHLGTHATYEWNPGKQAGLSPSCPPEVLIGDIPNIYPYIVDDVGEGIQAKRRGRAVIVSHLTPMLKDVELYQEYARMAELVDEYERARARASITAPEKFRELMELATKTGILADIASELPDRGAGNADDETVRVLGHYLEEINENLRPDGLHTFGKSPDLDDASEMAGAIVKRNPGESRKRITHGLMASGPAEINSLLAGFNGLYVEPGQGNDPVRNPGAIPTGRNFYGFNPSRIPTAAAWKLGARAADQMVDDYVKKHGRYPAKVAVVLWATETMRNEGVNECTILSLMGVRPRWSPSGRVDGLEVIPGARLGRPRIDVMINASGLYRDLFPDKLEYLDQALQLAMKQTDIENLIARNTRRIRASLIRKGLDEKEAEALSRLRIFSEKPGAYGTGVSEMTGASGLWEDEARVVDVYENRVGYAFGQGRWGVPARGLLRENLAGVEVALHSRSSNVYGLLDNDDMFQYLGGLAMAIRHESGHTPETLVTQQQKPGQVKVEDMARTLGREIRSRYLNPRWIKAMQEEDYAGAREMAHYFEYLWGWQVTTPDKVDQAKWNESYQVYVEDKYGLKMDEFFRRASPWAYQSITARMLEAIRKGYWNADDRIKQRLAAQYAVNVVENGVACCDHTCNNPMLNQMVVALISLPGVLSPEIAEKFRVAVEQAAKKSLEDQVRDRKRLLEELSSAGKQSARNAKAPGRDAARPGDKPRARGRASQMHEAGGKKAVESREVEGYRMEKIEQEQQDDAEMSSSGVDWLAGLFVLLLVCAAGYGMSRKV